MSDVKRYGHWINRIEDPNGPYVEYEDFATLTQERDALREENTRLRKYIGVMDAALKIPDGASTTGERCKRTSSLIGSDDWMEEPACPCVVCIDHVLTPSGEAGKGGGV